LLSTSERHKAQRWKRRKGIVVIGHPSAFPYTRCLPFATIIARLSTSLCGLFICGCFVHRSPDAERDANRGTSNDKDDKEDDQEPAFGPEPWFLWFEWLDREYITLVLV
jgi:hypothetical protein